jgi:ribosomal protein L37E
MARKKATRKSPRGKARPAKRRKAAAPTATPKKLRGWTRSGTNVTTPTGTVLSRDEVRSVGLSAEEAGDGRRTITSKDYQRVWRCLPLGLLSTMEEAAGGVAELKAFSKAEGLGAIAAASRAWLAKTREDDETGGTPHTPPPSAEENGELATCLADDSLSDADLLVAIGRELGRVPAMADAALQAALAAVGAPTTGRSFELKAELARRLGQRRAELADGNAHGSDSDGDPTVEQVAHSCTACGAERAERAFAGGGFPEKAGFCPRCATAAIGLFGGYLTTDSPMFTSMLQAAVADKPGFIAARDKHEAEQAAAAAADLPPDAGEMRRVKAIVEQIALDASHAKSLAVLRGGERHDILLGQKPLDPRHKELRRKAHCNRVQSLELRELQKVAGMECNAAVKELLTGQCAAIAARVGHEALRLKLLAAPGTWGAKAVADDERLAALESYVNPGDTPEEAADRKARYKKLMDAAAKKTPWGKGKWAKPDAAADADKPAGKSKNAKARARKAAAKKAAGAKKPGAKKVTFAAPVAGAAVAGTDGIVKAHITCHKCGRKGHFSDKCDT